MNRDKRRRYTFMKDFMINKKGTTVELTEAEAEVLGDYVQLEKYTPGEVKKKLVDELELLFRKFITLLRLEKYSEADKMLDETDDVVYLDTSSLIEEFGTVDTTSDYNYYTNSLEYVIDRLEMANRDQEFLNRKFLQANKKEE